MAYNLDKKLKEFEFERKQVLHHLALLDANIATLKRAIELTQQESDVALYNTENFEQNPDTPSEKHFDSVRKQLNEFYRRDWITRTQTSRYEVHWQWK